MSVSSVFPHRKYPCNECPIRADNRNNPAAKFPAERWACLSSTVRDPRTGQEPGMATQMFGCHKGEPGTNADLACAGWLAQFGGDHLAVRYAIITGRLSPEVLHPGENWPPLHESWTDVVSCQSLTEGAS